VRVALFTARGDGTPQPGLLTAEGVVGVGDLLDVKGSPQETMAGLIDDCDRLRLVLERRVRERPALPLDSVRLLPPLPEPGKIVCALEDPPEGGSGSGPRMYLKNPDAVHGDGDVLELPDEAEGLRHDAKLALVVKGPVKAVARDAWQTAVFGYMCFVDLTRPPQDEWGISWQTSFDTPCVIGRCIVTADEVPDPAALHAGLALDGPGVPGSATAAVGQGLPDLVELATSVMTLYTGDIVVGGASARVPAGPDARELEAGIEGLGSVKVGVEPARAPV
jgi:2-keto-4-pentenoate hydratase/2-oxohepta-3-ene-1,7-dioic acid hydratase in catechol pathway